MEMGMELGNERTQGTGRFYNLSFQTSFASFSLKTGVSFVVKLKSGANDEEKGLCKLQIEMLVARLLVICIVCCGD
jgi:hypothetical protein